MRAQLVTMMEVRAKLVAMAMQAFISLFRVGLNCAAGLDPTVCPLRPSCSGCHSLSQPLCTYRSWIVAQAWDSKCYPGRALKIAICQLKMFLEASRSLMAVQ